MKKIFFSMFYALIFIIVENSAPAENTNRFIVSAQLRNRGEVRYLPPSDNGSKNNYTGFINERARIGLQYEQSRLSVKLSGQHVGVWGQYDLPGHFELNEAWARLNLGKSWFFKIGRQPLSYDNERIFGASDWEVRGLFHDAFLTGYENKNNKLHLVLSYNQNNEDVFGTVYVPSASVLHKSMQMLWYHHDFASVPLGMSLLISNMGFGDKITHNGRETQYMQTFGCTGRFFPRKWDFSGELYFQTGNNRFAYMFGLNAAFNINKSWSLNIGYDFLSGDEGKEEVTTFLPIYATNHNFYGAMDYFYTGKKYAYFSGLSDARAGANWKLSPSLAMELACHFFVSTRNLPLNMSSFMGGEIDYMIGWNIMKNVKLSAGCSVMIADYAMRYTMEVSSDKLHHWTWLSLNISPDIFVR